MTVMNPKGPWGKSNETDEKHVELPTPSDMLVYPILVMVIPS